MLLLCSSWFVRFIYLQYTDTWSTTWFGICDMAQKFRRTTENLSNTRLSLDSPSPSPSRFSLNFSNINYANYLCDQPLNHASYGFSLVIYTLRATNAFNYSAMRINVAQFYHYDQTQLCELIFHPSSQPSELILCVHFITCELKFAS